MRPLRALLFTLLLVLTIWIGPLLAWMWINSIGLRQDYPDAVELFMAAPVAALTGIVRVKGTEEDGRYLLRGRIGGISVFTTGMQGWHVEWQGGNGYAFARGDERLSGSCRRFTGGFEVCDLHHWNVKSRKAGQSP